MTDMLTTDELIEHIRTALGGVGPQQVKRVLKAVGVLAHRERAALARAEAAEEERAELRAANEALADRLVFEMEQRETLAARVAELEAQLASADDEIASASAQAARFWRTNNKLAERVAELEAERALPKGGDTQRATWTGTHPLETLYRAALFTAIGLDPALLAPTDEADALRELAAEDTTGVAELRASIARMAANALEVGVSEFVQPAPEAQ